jgi:predicted esterase
MKLRTGLIITISTLALAVLFGRWGSFKSLHLDSKYSTLTAHIPDHTHATLEGKNVDYIPRNALITIFVHGNIGLRQHLSLSNIIRFTKDDVHGTEYAKAVSIMRNDPIFFKMQAMQELGLKRMDPDCIKPGYACGAMALLFEQVNSTVHDTMERNYYTFGWSGITTESARYQAAQELYHALVELVIRYNNSNITPKIRIIGYSHGGNVGLNLGAVNEYSRHPFTVDELVLLGTPILVETDHLIHSELFERVYHLYSHSDRVQTMDCFSSRRFFSKKTFQSRASFEPPSKLRQIEVRVTDTIRAKRPHSKSTHLFTRSNKSFISGKARFLRDRSPGHFELWCFGWTPQGYRKKYPLYPLPTVCLTPLIIAEVEQYLRRCTHDPHEKLVVDFRPAYGQMIVRKQNNCDDWQICPFLTHDALNELAGMLQAYVPHNFTVHEYQSRLEEACKQAKGWQDETYESDTFNTPTAQL